MHINEQNLIMMQQTLGMVPLSSDLGKLAFQNALSSHQSQLLVVEGKSQTLREKFLGVFNPVNQIQHKTINENSLVEQLSQDLLQMVSQLLKIKPENLDADDDISDYGFDSILLTEFVNKLNKALGLSLLPTLFFEHNTLESLANYLMASHPHELRQKYKMDGDTTPILIEPVAAAQPHKRQRFATIPQSLNHGPIAVIGMACQFPQAKNVDEFWQNLVEGKDCISEIPKDRWDWQAIYGDGPEQTKVKYGGFIEDIDKFDAQFFGISPREAELMDPQHRLLMQTVWYALEDACYKKSDLASKPISIFIGISTHDYMHYLQAQATEAQASTGMAHSMAANRISHWLNLQGPSEPVDTACSSSLVALHRAMQSIQNDGCEMAIAAGVNIILSPQGVITFDKMGVLTQKSYVKTFDKSADGYVRGEGVGAVLLKPLSQAISDGDHIHATIKGSAINHSGRSQSLTAPNPQGQQKTVTAALKQAGILDQGVDYIEGHGTATELGDPIEIIAFKHALSNSNITKIFVQNWGN